MKTKITFVHLCRLRSRPDAACRRPGWGNCSRCGSWRELVGGGKGFRFPRFCDVCLRRMDKSEEARK